MFVYFRRGTDSNIGTDINADDNIGTDINADDNTDRPATRSGCVPLRRPEIGFRRSRARGQQRQGLCAIRRTHNGARSGPDDYQSVHGIVLQNRLIHSNSARRRDTDYRAGH